MAPKKRITTTELDNAITESFLYKRFELLALNTFKWTGLPETIEERHIERVLFSEGKALFFRDKLDGLLCLRCGYGLGINVYGDPTSYHATGFNYSKEVRAADSVLIENNKLRMPTQAAILYFVKQLYEIIRARDVNIKTLKAPFIVACDDKSLLTMKKAFEDIDNNNFVIYGDKTYNLAEAITVLQTGVKCLTAELTDCYHDVLNEALTYLGINNANTDKKERLITSEAESNNQFIDSCAEMFLEARKRACEQINAKFGLNVSVELRNQREPIQAAESEVLENV